MEYMVTMIQKIKKHLLYLLCVAALLGGMTACDGLNVNCGNGTGTGTGSGNENGNENGGENGGDENTHELVNCWHLVALYGAEVDVDIYIDFGKDGKFAIYQRTESLEFTVLNGT